MPSLMRKLKSTASRAVQYRPPAAFARNFAAIDARGEAEIVASLKEHYFTRRIWEDGTPSVEAWLASPEGRKDLDMHLWSRTDVFRRTVTPWLDSIRSLKGATVLEIGCGTGTSTVTLAEQGAIVTAIDLDEPSLCVARDRARVFGQSVEFLCANAAELDRHLAGRRFDVVLFIASLEHMLHPERIAAIRSTWAMLNRGGIWGMADTPNRLWYLDAHTSGLPFFAWLPDDLAFDYTRFSPRQLVADSYHTPTPGAVASFLRHGRGVSYHEFDLALGLGTYEVLGSLPVFLRQHSLLKLRELRWQLSRDGRYQRLLASLGPRIHLGFYEPSLDLILRKPGAAR